MIDTLGKSANHSEKFGKSRGLSGKIIDLLDLNGGCMKVADMMKPLGESERTIYRNLKILEAQNLVVNLRPMWNLANRQSIPLKNDRLLKSDNTINLHNLSFVIKLIQKPFWWNQRNNRLLKLKDHQLKQIGWGNNLYTQLMKDNYVIQLHKNSMIIILKKPYTGTDPWDCFIQGVDDFLAVYSYIEGLFGFRFFADGVPQAMVRSQHYVKLNDAIAKHCKRSGNKFEVWVGDKLRMLVDTSHPTGLEAINREYATDDISKYVEYVTDIITKGSLLPSEATSLLERSIQAQATITANQAVFDANMKSHIAAVQTLGWAVEKFNDNLQDFVKIVKQGR